MGGMRAVEWATSHPDRVATCIVLASTAYATADQIAWCQPQLLAIRSDPNFHGGDYYAHGVVPADGLGIARRIAHVTYRHEGELAERFGRVAQPGEEPLGGGGRYAVESYLDHHAGKLGAALRRQLLPRPQRGDEQPRRRPGSRGSRRGARGLPRAASSWRGSTPTASIPSGCPTRSRRCARAPILRRVTSRFGHDGFLIEIEQVGAIIREALARTARRG